MYHSKKTATSTLEFYSYKCDPILLIFFVNIFLNKISIFPSLHPIAMYGSFLQYWHSARYVPLYMKVFCLNLALCTWLYWVSSLWKPLYIPVLPCSFSFLRLVSFSNLMITRSVPSSRLLSTILKLLMTLTPVWPHFNALEEWQCILD